MSGNRVIPESAVTARILDDIVDGIDHKLRGIARRDDNIRSRRIDHASRIPPAFRRNVRLIGSVKSFHPARAHRQEGEEIIQTQLPAAGKQIEGGRPGKPRWILDRILDGGRRRGARFSVKAHRDGRIRERVGPAGDHVLELVGKSLRMCE